jgi:hypothetical protein
MSKCKHHFMDRGNACALCFKELEAKLEVAEAENARLRLRATAVIEDNYLTANAKKKPSMTDSYGINAVLLWHLKSEVG